MSHLLDVNVWLALALSHHAFHDACRRWFDGVGDPDRIAFCRATQQGLLRLLTNRRVLEPYGRGPLTNAAAWEVYEAFVADPRITSAAEPPGLDAGWKHHAAIKSPSTKLWMDAYLAAFAQCGEFALVTTDTDFRRFAGLRVTLLAGRE